MAIKTRDITVSGLVIALTTILGATGIGFIPVPSLAGAATLMHLPVILAGLVSTPIVAAVSGLVFGLFSFRYMGDFRVVLPARLLMGIVTYLIYAIFRRKKWAIPLAAAAGSATNTIGTLFLAVIFGYIPAGGSAGAVAIGIANGLPELIIASILLIPITLAVEKIRK